MYALFDDAGKFHTGRILSEAESSAQIELDSGKRVKAKLAHVLLRFEKPAPTQLLTQAQQLMQSVDLELAWEFAPEEDFGFEELACEYFSNSPSATEQAAILLTLHEAPHYFRRAGKGRYRKASFEVIQQALAAIEKKKLIQQQIDEWAQALAQQQCPEAIGHQLYRILFKPDKNSAEYKAVVQAARTTQLNVLDLLRQAHAIESAYQFHWQRFLFENFPKGIDFPQQVQTQASTALMQELATSEVQAYSIDDSNTTEIDDALSVQNLGSGIVTLGIHIAAPGLAITPDSALDQVARQRLSTVYMPGAKITMLPDGVVREYTLEEGRLCPAVSLYLRIDEQSLQVLDHTTRLERVHIAANLRNDQLEHLITQEWIDSIEAGDSAAAHAAQSSDALLQGMPPQNLVFLYRLAQALKSRREVIRGKPETFSRPDYTFALDIEKGFMPTGTETVRITERQRGSPLDLIVAEAMILANSTWGQWLADSGVPGIYRSQAGLAPGIKARMGTKALPHAGIGVPCYAWSTSPLRRYTDLVNQWQIIACAQHGRTAALAAPFRPKDAGLFSIISAFEAAYSAYHAHQASMERFWTLKYLQQNNITELEASVIKEGENGAVLVRANTLPLVFPALGLPGAARNTQVLVRLGAIDEIALDLTSTVIQKLSDSDSLGQEDAALDTSDEDDAEVSAGPLVIAVDVNETESPSPPTEPSS